jgi:hypothetical protein
MCEDDRPEDTQDWVPREGKKKAARMSEPPAAAGNAVHKAAARRRALKDVTRPEDTDGHELGD